MKISSWVTPEGLEGHMWPADHGLSTTAIETSKYSLLATMQREALLTLAIACKISNQKTNKYATQTAH